MKKLSPEEASKIHPLKKGKYTWLFRELATLNPGEGLVIATHEWKGKRTPYAVIRNAAITLSMQFDYGRMPDGSGWVVKRVG